MCVHGTPVPRAGKTGLFSLRGMAYATCGEIASKAGLPTPKVMGRMGGLLKAGLVATPLQGKYVLTQEGALCTAVMRCNEAFPMAGERGLA
ncbi:MAG: hypothetical protein HYZ81_03460 [Nitrospinae bacterium]|nr:hypothetical protein [Nitrospinota bacterium]